MVIPPPVLSCKPCILHSVRFRTSVIRARRAQCSVSRSSCLRTSAIRIALMSSASLRAGSPPARASRVLGSVRCSSSVRLTGAGRYRLRGGLIWLTFGIRSLLSSFPFISLVGAAGVAVTGAVPPTASPPRVRTSVFPCRSTSRFPILRSPLVVRTRGVFRGHHRPVVHARIEFPIPVAGPLVLGSGRHFGYGLMEPVESLS